MTKSEIIAAYAQHEGDTGSPEVQIALLTERINHLNEHLKPAADGRPPPQHAGVPEEDRYRALPYADCPAEPAQVIPPQGPVPKSLLKPPE